METVPLAYYHLPWLVRCMYVLFPSTAIPTEKLLKFQLQTVSFYLLLNSSKLHCSLGVGFVLLTYESNYGYSLSRPITNYLPALRLTLDNCVQDQAKSEDGV